MSYDKIVVPAGEKITSRNGKLEVPDNPIIAFIEGDGIGPDIMKASLRIWDAAVEKAYGGKRKIAWMEVYSGEKAAALYNGDYMPEETFDALREYLIGIKGPLTTPVGGGRSTTIPRPRSCPSAPAAQVGRRCASKPGAASATSQTTTDEASGTSVTRPVAKTSCAGPSRSWRSWSRSASVASAPAETVWAASTAMPRVPARCTGSPRPTSAKMRPGSADAGAFARAASDDGAARSGAARPGEAGAPSSRDVQSRQSASGDIGRAT